MLISQVVVYNNIIVNIKMADLLENEIELFARMVCADTVWNLNKSKMKGTVIGKTYTLPEKPKTYKWLYGKTVEFIPENWKEVVKA